MGLSSPIRKDGTSRIRRPQAALPFLVGVSSGATPGVSRFLPAPLPLFFLLFELPPPSPSPRPRLEPDAPSYEGVGVTPLAPPVPAPPLCLLFLRFGFEGRPEVGVLGVLGDAEAAPLSSLPAAPPLAGEAETAEVDGICRREMSGFRPVELRWNSPGFPVIGFSSMYSPPNMWMAKDCSASRVSRAVVLFAAGVSWLLLAPAPRLAGCCWPSGIGVASLDSSRVRPPRAPEAVLGVAATLYEGPWEGDHVRAASAAGKTLLRAEAMVDYHVTARHMAKAERLATQGGTARRFCERGGDRDGKKNLPRGSP